MKNGFDHVAFAKILDFVSDGKKDYQIAKDIGVSPSTLSKWKNGRSEPSISDLIRISKRYYVSIEELLNISPVTVSEAAAALTPRRICREIAALDDCVPIGISENPENGRMYVTIGTGGQTSDEIQLFLRMFSALRQTSRKENSGIDTRKRYTEMIDKLLESVSDEPFLQHNRVLFLGDPITAEETDQL